MVPNKSEFVRSVFVRFVLTREDSDKFIPERFMPERFELCKKDFLRFTPLKSIFRKSLCPKFDARKSVLVIIVFLIIIPCKLEY